MGAHQAMNARSRLDRWGIGVTGSKMKHEPDAESHSEIRSLRRHRGGSPFDRRVQPPREAAAGRSDNGRDGVYRRAPPASGSTALTSAADATAGRSRERGRAPPPRAASARATATKAAPTPAKTATRTATATAAVSPTVLQPTPQQPPPAAGHASGTDVLAGTACQVFPTNNYWHADVRSLPVDAHSAAWLSAMGASTRHLHPDFGPSGDPAAPYGIPVTVAPTGHAAGAGGVRLRRRKRQRRTRFGADTKIEGGATADGDRHAIVVTADTCELFETWDTHSTASGWTAGSGAHWALSSNALRPAGWTSADAAGLPILPGLLRWDEVAAGHVDHAIRFTTEQHRRQLPVAGPPRRQLDSQSVAAADGRAVPAEGGLLDRGLLGPTQTVLRA